MTAIRKDEIEATEAREPAESQTLRFVLCGDSGDGKSSLVESLLSGVEAAVTGDGTADGFRSFASGARDLVVHDSTGGEAELS